MSCQIVAELTLIELPIFIMKSNLLQTARKMPARHWQKKSMSLRKNGCRANQPGKGAILSISPAESSRAFLSRVDKLAADLGLMKFNNPAAPALVRAEEQVAQLVVLLTLVKLLPHPRKTWGRGKCPQKMVRKSLAMVRRA
jgi:hypothetical protein